MNLPFTILNISDRVQNIIFDVNNELVDFFGYDRSGVGAMMCFEMKRNLPIKF